LHSPPQLSNSDEEEIIDQENILAAGHSNADLSEFESDSDSVSSGPGSYIAIRMYYYYMQFLHVPHKL